MIGIDVLTAARQQMAFSLGFHIVLSCFGVGFPALIYLLHRRGIKRGDEHALSLARRSPTGYRRIGCQKVGGAGIRCCRPTTGCAPHRASLRTSHPNEERKWCLTSLMVVN